MPLGSIPVDGDPVYLATNRTGHYLLSAYYSLLVSWPTPCLTEPIRSRSGARPS
jgi:hypothetical protein